VNDVSRNARAVATPPESGVAEAPAIAPAAWLALHRAAERAAVAVEASPDGGWPAVELRDHFAGLCRAVRAVADGRDPPLESMPTGVPLHRLLDALRREFLAAAEESERAPDASSALRVLRAIERVAEALSRDAAQRFAGSLQGRDALDLVVEIAHDMRSPLSSILFLAERLRSTQSGPVNAVQERQLGLVYSAAFGLSSMASDVIELARSRERLVDAQPIAFSVSAILRSVQDIVRPMAEEKGLTMEFTAPELDVRIGHPAALNRVLLNLTTNAIKFTNSGSVKVAALAKPRHRVEFAVVDTGRGIPPQVVATLFDAFRRRARPGEYAFSSAGLGLSICRKLVGAMRGELTVDTELERGTTFAFSLELPPASRM
jgi:signal transduction histidine kinase